MYRSLLLALLCLAACGGPAAEQPSPPAEPPGEAQSAGPTDTASAELEEAILRAEAEADLEKRRASMENREACLKKAAQLPENVRASVEASCRNR